jgi:hypothetical protein
MGILAPARGSYREDLCQSASEAIARRGTPPAPIDLLNVKAQPTRERRLSFRCIPCGLRLSRSCRQSIRVTDQRLSPARRPMEEERYSDQETDAVQRMGADAARRRVASLKSHA